MRILAIFVLGVCSHSFQLMGLANLKSTQKTLRTRCSGLVSNWFFVNFTVFSTNIYTSIW